MSRFHVSEDETGFFQLTFEDDDGNLTLVSYHSEDSKQLIEDATKMAASGDFGEATVVVDPKRRPVFESADADETRPAPRKAGQ